MPQKGFLCIAIENLVRVCFIEAVQSTFVWTT